MLKKIKRHLLYYLKNKLEYDFKKLLINYPKIIFAIIKNYLTKINYFQRIKSQRRK